MIYCIVYNIHIYTCIYFVLWSKHSLIYPHTIAHPKFTLSYVNITFRKTMYNNVILATSSATWCWKLLYMKLVFSLDVFDLRMCLYHVNLSHVKCLQVMKQCFSVLSVHTQRPWLWKHKAEESNLEIRIHYNTNHFMVFWQHDETSSKSHAMLVCHSSYWCVYWRALKCIACACVCPALHWNVHSNSLLWHLVKLHVQQGPLLHSGHMSKIVNKKFCTIIFPFLHLYEWCQYWMILRLTKKK